MRQSPPVLRRFHPETKTPLDVGPPSFDDRPSAWHRMIGGHLIPLPEGRAGLRRSAPWLLGNPGRNRWWVVLFESRTKHVSSGTRPHPFSGCCRRRGRHSTSPSRCRSDSAKQCAHGVAPHVRTVVGCPSIKPPVAWCFAVADKTMVRKVFGNSSLSKWLEFNNVRTLVFHNCGQCLERQGKNKHAP